MHTMDHVHKRLAIDKRVGAETPRSKQEITHQTAAAAASKQAPYCSS